jgi:hypothetical protein
MSVILDHNLKVMIISTSLILTTAVVKKGLLLLLLNPALTPQKKVFEDWLDNDGFKKDYSKDLTKRDLFNELNMLKEKYKKDYDGEWKSENGKKKMILPIKENGEELSPGEIKMALLQLEIRIKKVRLMIEHEYYIIKNHHKPTNVNYIVVRSNWLDNNGNKFKKFSKNIGAEEKVLVDGKVPPRKLDEAKKEIDSMMLEYYKQEYPNL